MPIPALIAHRGFAKRYPENTLVAIHEALKAGAAFVEFDIQYTADGHPVLLHDVDLKRVAGIDKDVVDLSLSELQRIHIGRTPKARSQYPGLAIPTLADAVYLIKAFPHVHAFVEIKTETLNTFGIEQVIKTLIQVLAPIKGQCSLISHNSLAIRCARAMGLRSIGWVISHWNSEVRSMATELAPDYLFCNHKKIPSPSERLWPGPWRWVLYDVNKPELAIKLGERGADMIETTDIGRMLEHPVFNQAQTQSLAS